MSTTIFNVFVYFRCVCDYTTIKYNQQKFDAAGKKMQSIGCALTLLITLLVAGRNCRPEKRGRKG